MLTSIAASGGRYGLIQGRPGPEPYPYLHTLDYLKVSQDSAAYSGKESISQTHWTAWLRGRDDARVWTQDGLIHATHPLDRQTVAIVVLPEEPVDFGYVYGVLCVGLLLSGFIWFIGLRARASLGRWAYPVVGGAR